MMHLHYFFVCFHLMVRIGERASKQQQQQKCRKEKQQQNSVLSRILIYFSNTNSYTHTCMAWHTKSAANTQHRKLIKEVKEEKKFERQEETHSHVHTHKRKNMKWKAKWSYKNEWMNFDSIFDLEKLKIFFQKWRTKKPKENCTGGPIACRRCSQEANVRILQFHIPRCLCQWHTLTSRLWTCKQKNKIIFQKPYISISIRKIRSEKKEVRKKALTQTLAHCVHFESEQSQIRNSFLFLSQQQQQQILLFFIPLQFHKNQEL